MPEESKKPQEPKAPPKQIQAQPGQVKKKPLWKRFKEAMFVETAKDVGKYLWKDVLLPAIKKLIADSGTNAINMAIYGQPKSPNVTHVSQSSIYAGNRQGRQFNRANRYQSVMDHCPTCDRQLIEDIMDEIEDQIRRYGRISVETLSQILPGELSFETVHTDSYWGWTSLNRNGCIVGVAGGYVLSLPPAVPLQ